MGAPWLQVLKMLCLAALVALVATRWLGPLDTATVGVLTLYVLLRVST